MCVITDETEPVRPAETGHRLLCLTIPHGEPKFRVSSAGAHLVMGVHVDARIEAQNDSDMPSRVSRHALEEGDLEVIVDGNEPDTGSHRFLELDPALVVAVKNHVCRIDPCAQPGVNLAPRYDIESDPLLDQNAHQCWREIGLARVDEPGPIIGLQKCVPDAP